MIIQHIQNKAEAKAFALYMANERKRHFADIRQIDRDLEALQNVWNITPPVLDDIFWVQVEGGTTHGG